MATINEILREAYTHWDDAEALRRAGHELHDRNRLPFAQEVLGRALELDPESDPRTWEYYAFSYLRHLQDEKGFSILRRGVEVTDSDEIRATLSSFTPDEAEAKALEERAKASDDPAARAGWLWKQMRAGSPQESLDGVKKLVEEHPDNSSLRETLAWMLIQAAHGKMADVDLRAEGLPLAEARIEEEPDRISGYTALIQMNLVIEDWTGVLAATERALARFPDEETVMHLRGQAYQKLGDEDRAAQWFGRAIGAKPSFAGARRDLGKLYEGQGKLDLAEELFREIPVAYPHYSPGPMSLAMFLARQGRMEEAERVFVETWPKLPDWFKGMIKNSPDAAALLERDAVKTVVGDSAEDGEE